MKKMNSIFQEALNWFQSGWEKAEKTQHHIDELKLKSEITLAPYRRF